MIFKLLKQSLWAIAVLAVAAIILGVAIPVVKLIGDAVIEFWMP